MKIKWKPKCLCLVLVLASFLVACGPKEAIYHAGSYIGLAEGYHSNLKVEVTTDEFRIVDIQILEQDETPLIADIVYAEIPKAVIKANSTKVDVVAGATYTSATLLAAIDNSLAQARIVEETPPEGGGDH